MEYRFVSWSRRTIVAAVLLGAVTLVKFANAHPFEIPDGSDLVGEIVNYETDIDDTLMKVAEDNRLGFAEILAANPGVDPWLPGTDIKLVLPTAYLLPRGPRTGIVINLPEQRLYQYLPHGRVQTFPVAAEKPGCGLNPGRTVVKQRRRHPSWRPSEEVRARRPDLTAIMPPGPLNPLGKYALDLELPGRIIHGARRPFSTRSAEGYGCIQLYTEDMVSLYQASRKGMPVVVIDQPVKLGWSKGELYMEAHPTREQVADLSRSHRMRLVQTPGFDTRLAQVAGAEMDRVDRALAHKLIKERRGIPVRITRPRPPPKTKKVRGLFKG